jgi:peptide/nickel transport system permease protein
MSQQPTGAAALPEQAIGGMRQRRTFLQSVLYFFRRKPLGGFGAIVAALLIVLAIFAPQIANHDPRTTDYRTKYANPNSEMFFGGDDLGRDVFSRIVYGSRVSLQVGLVSAFVGATIGMMLGIISVHFGGAVDLLIQRVVDAMMSIPGIILAITIMVALGGASVTNVMIALSISFIPSTARVLRSQALAIKEMDYILAARAIGANHWRIMMRHIAPNCLAQYIVLLTLFLGAAIIAEASLSYLGIGASPDEPTWGGMLRSATATYIKVAPWLAVFPGLAIVIVVFAWNLLGDSLRDVLDPRLRGAD